MKKLFIYVRHILLYLFSKRCKMKSLIELLQNRIFTNLIEMYVPYEIIGINDNNREYIIRLAYNDKQDNSDNFFDLKLSEANNTLSIEITVLTPMSSERTSHVTNILKENSNVILPYLN